MKTLYVLRHAKSSWDDAFSNDHDRPLAPRGIKAASCMGQVLGAFENPPALALTSSAQRARQTTDLICQTFPALSLNPPEIKVDSRIYNASAPTLATLLQELPDEYDSVVLVGHNPTMAELVSLLCFEHIQEGVQMPTGGLACITFEVTHWQELQHGMGWLTALVFPRLVKRLLPKNSD